MAAFPCCVGLHRYAGPQRSVYVTRLNGARPETGKLRLCPRHFEEERLLVQEHMSEISGDGQMSILCELGDCQVSRKTTIFVKIFDQGADPEEFAADVCEAHESWLLGQLCWDISISM